MSETKLPTDRAFVLGLDGVPWRHLESWMESGDLPAFARLCDKGAAGPLKSTMPPTTALAWPTIATGVNPDKHGVYAFQRLSQDYSQRMATSEDLRQPALWDLLSPAVAANVPMTYPASPIDGEMVTGMMTPETNDKFTHPPELRETIRAEIPDYEIGLKWAEYADRPQEFREDLSSLLEARRSLMRLLLERNDPRLFFFVYTAPDRLQHLLWDEETMLEHYRQLDDILAEVLDHVEEAGGNLFVVSDHGFGPISKYVAVNTVLERAGLLSRRQNTGTRSLLARAGLSKDAILSTLGSVGLDQETLVRYLPRSLVDGVAQRVPGSHSLYDVDHTNTTAFVHGAGGVYVNDTERFDGGTVSPGERAAVKQQVRGIFESVTDPETGEHVLRVFDGDELFPTDDESPDLIVRAIDGYQKITGLSDDVFSDTGATKASHRREGVFLAWGPDIASSSTPEDASVVDVAPTVLHSIGEPVPAAADGSVLDSIFDSQSATARRRIASATYGDETESADESDDDFDDVEDRLRGLGYME